MADRSMPEPVFSCALTAASSAASARASGKTITVSACVRVIIPPMISVYSSDRAHAGLILAHGAGGGQRSEFIVRAANALSARGVMVATFDFPYMTAGRSVPDKASVLEAHWRSVVDEIG